MGYNNIENFKKDEGMGKNVLGLDIGSNSIGFELLEINEKINPPVFKELAGNSIIFATSETAEDRRNARSARRIHERKSARNKSTRKIFVSYGIASKGFVDDTTNYLNAFVIKNKDVYKIREKALSGKKLDREEFILATYSILTDRGYNNMFATVQSDDKDDEDGIINEAVNHNKTLYKENAYSLPSMVLTEKRKNLENTYQNIPIRNKKGDYSHSLDRELHKEEFEKVVRSQSDNQELFKDEAQCRAFIDILLDETIANRPFYQRPLKSFEGMVEYCSFYDEFNPNGSQKRMPLANVANIELTLRQSIDNYEAVNKNGEIRKFVKDEIDHIINFWIDTPSADKINNKNIFKNAGFKDVKIHIKENKELLILNIQAHRGVLDVLNHYGIDFKGTQNDFYNEMLLELYYYKNSSSRIAHIEKIIKKYTLDLEDGFSKTLASLHHLDGFASFSLKFAREVLKRINKDGKTHYEALESLEYYNKYLDMPSYTYLPPLEPTKADILWLEANIEGFKTEHLFYQPMMSPKVKRVISILRKLINELIKKYGKIDEIRIETAKEMNSTKEEDEIKKNQSANSAKNNEAIKFLKNKSMAQSHKNIERVKLFKEQQMVCLYSNDKMTEEEALDENITEIEHFIPRSVIWINSYKNKILVKKKYNQNKGSQNPIAYLTSIGEWENFKGRIKLHIKSPKYKWLTDEEVINSAMSKEYWQESYLNDTRSATRAIQKYLNHYLYPQKNIHGKDEERHIFSVTGKAISELKYIWGIHNIMPKDKEDKKDRNTNYHHTLDAFAIALCSPSAIQAIHNHFKQNENKFKTKALKEKLANTLPISENGTNIVEHLKSLVKRYETNELYVCPYGKKKTNIKGFKDGNLKLYVTTDPKDESKEILSEMEKVHIDTSLLIERVGQNVKPRSDSEVKKEIQSIQTRLNPQKQKNIIKAIEIYANALLETRDQIDGLTKQKKESESQKKKNAKTDKDKAYNQNIVEEKLFPIEEELKKVSKVLQDTRCSYAVKNGKRQIVRSLNLHKVKIGKTSADSIVFSRRDEKSVERLSIFNFKDAIRNKEPFVIKANESTLCVELYDHPKQNQVVGLKYFSSIANPDIKTKTNEKYGNYFEDKKPSLILYKNDIIKVTHIKDGSVEYFVFNGGGNISTTRTGVINQLNLENINLNSFIKINKKGVVTESKIYSITPNKSTIISKVKIDFFGNITED